MDLSDLRGSTAIVGIGYSRSNEAPGGFSRRSNEAVLTLVVRAVREACADAGIESSAIDSAVTFQANDSVNPQDVLRSIGAQEVLFEANESGGGNYAAQGVMLAAMAIHVGLAKVCLVYRGMNGRSGVRIGELGTTQHRQGYAAGPAQFTHPYGLAGAAAAYALQARRWMEAVNLRSIDLGELAVRSRANAACNPRALLREPITLEDHQSSRMIVDPYHLLDCCLDADVACALVITSTHYARQLRQIPVQILGGVGGPGRFADSSDTGFKYMRDSLFRAAGVTLDDIDLALLYDNFTDCPMRMIEDIGWCGPGESADYIRDGHISLDGGVPMQTQGGLMNEGYCHGLNNVLEAVQQLRGQAEDLCPSWSNGKHTYDRSTCRQVRQADVALQTGVIGKSAMILANAS